VNDAFFHEGDRTYTCTVFRMASQHSSWLAHFGSLWLLPFIEYFHIFGIVALVGATGILDLRLQPETLLPAQNISSVSRRRP
jgi:hypothetical protein